MNVTTIGIDLAKHSFSLHGVDSRGKLVFRKTLTRAKLMPFLGTLPPCLIGMEACSGAHHWARSLQVLGHRVGIMASRFVAPYRARFAFAIACMLVYAVANAAYMNLIGPFLDFLFTGEPGSVAPTGPGPGSEAPP